MPKDIPLYFSNQVIEDNGLAYEELICLEELSELQKEITKHLRGKGNIQNIISEIADVYICLSHLQTGLFISDREINEAIMMKTERYFERRESGDTK
jgi:hypothetical protein